MEFSQKKSVSIPFGSAMPQIGNGSFAIIAGPCSIESREHLLETATAVKAGGACILRGGIYKMRTNPSSFQGLGSSAFSFIKEVKTQLNMPIVSEVTDPRQISDLMGVVDMFQVGSRSMYHYSLLRELAQTQKPVILKRGFSATVEEWLNAAEYLVQGGNEKIIFCERGIRTFETTTRNTLDLNSVAYLKHHTPWPVIVDPSHGTGRPELIKPMSLAAAAAGADGLLIEVHPQPKDARSDGHQALTPQMFTDIVNDVEKLLPLLGKKLARLQ